MPPEPLPFDRKDFFKERKPSSSDPAGVVPAQWREPPTSHPNNHGYFSYPWGGASGSSDFRRPLSGHGKQVGGGWGFTTGESAPVEDKFGRNNNIRENNHSNSLAVTSSSQNDRKEGNSWETTLSSNGSSHPRLDLVNSWDQHQSKDQHDKNNISTTGGHRLECQNSLGSSFDWKPLKWIRSGSLSSRGSGFSHSSSSKSIGVDFHDSKIDCSAGNSTPVRSPSGEAVHCLTPGNLADEVSSRKKPRLGWGEGLAKYEKKKVGPDDIVYKDVQARNGMVDGVSSSDLLLPSPANVSDKSPGLTGCSECASPATPYSFACSSSPGVEEKTAAVDNDISNPSVSLCHSSNNHTEGSTFNVERLELIEGFNFSSSLNELLQCDDTSVPTSGFVRCNAMDKLQVWKADISRTLEITESEIDSLENELKLLIPDVGGSCALAAACSLPTECNDNTNEKSKLLTFRVASSGNMLFEKGDDFVERSGVGDLERECSGTETSKIVESVSLCNSLSQHNAVDRRDSICLLDVSSEITEAKCSEDNVSNDILTACNDGSQVQASSTVLGGGVHFSKDQLYELIMDSNKGLANQACDEFSNLLPSSQWCSNVPKVTNELLIKKKIAIKKRFLKFKERVMTLKFRAFQYLWKEDLRVLSVRRSGSKSQKKIEFGFADHQKYRSSLKYRLSSAGSLNQDQTTEIVDYLNKLISDSQVRIYRNELKMPSFILDRREQMRSRFISDNRLVENPIDVEKERSIINPWTVEEKEIFLNKYSLFGKNFKKIASFLEQKTIADCVEFYYKNHKSDRFQKTKKNSVFAKGKSSSANTYLVTSGRRLNREADAASLEMLGAASAMLADVDTGVPRQRKCTPNAYVDHTYNNQKLSDGDDSISESSIARFCNERETVAADVLAGICGSISSEALGSCITSSGDVHHQGRGRSHNLGGTSERLHMTPEDSSLNDVDEETCSDDSCGEEMESSDWTDEEKSSFLKAVRDYGKDFSMISQYMRTRSSNQCRVFFSKSRKCLGLDMIDFETGSEGKRGGGSDHDHNDACMVHSGSVVSHDKSFPEGKTDIEDLHSSDFREEQDGESDQNLVSECEAENKIEVELVGERSCNGSLEGAADSETVNTEEAVQNSFSQGCSADMNSPCSSGAKIEDETFAKKSSKICREGIKASEHHLSSEIRLNDNTSTVKGFSCCQVEDLNSASQNSLDLSTDHGSIVKLNASDKVIASEEPDNGFFMSSLFPEGPTSRKTNSRDDVLMSSRLSFRKRSDRLSQRCSSTDLHFPKHSLLESSQILRGYPVRSSADQGMNGILSCKEAKGNITLELMDSGDGFIEKCPGLISEASLSQEQAHSSPDVEKPSRCGDVKLFGQILTRCSEESGGATHFEGKTSNGGKPFNLKFDNHIGDRRSDVDQKNNYSFHVDKSVAMRSYGYWDGKRIQTTLTDSAMLQAKYPAAFSNMYMEQHQQQLHSFLKSGNDQHQHHGFGKKGSSRGSEYVYGNGMTLGGKEEESVSVNDPVDAMQYGNYK